MQSTSFARAAERRKKRVRALSELLAAYNIFAGELWIVVVAGVLLAPRVVQVGLR